MSFPTIPNINPNISIKREDAINLLLVSIAVEELSLADLIDAEAEKISRMVKDGEKKHSVNDVKDINRSVDQTLKDIIKLQMLLQFKLENIQEITCPFTTTTATSTSTSTSTSTTTTTTKTAATSTKTMTRTSTTSNTTSTATEKKCKRCLTGEAQGCISEKCDFFSGGTASIKTSIYSCSCCTLKNMLSYSIRKDDLTESIKADPCSIKIGWQSLKNPLAIKIEGVCSIIMKTCSQQYITDTGSFELTVWDILGTKSFRMVIAASNKPILDHDSGEVIINDSGLNKKNRLP